MHKLRERFTAHELLGSDFERVRHDNCEAQHRLRKRGQLLQPPAPAHGTTGVLAFAFACSVWRFCFER
jgi:hypothetical protein